MDVKIEETKLLLCDSFFCRLCCEENENGLNLFSVDDIETDLFKLINKYLPIKIDKDDQKFPKTICPGCHIQLESTKLFMDLIVEGQAKLRELYFRQQELLQRQEKERIKLEEALQTHNPNASVKTLVIGNDNEGEKFIIQIYTEGPLFPLNHELSLKVEGLNKPKRKRGRPPKPQVVEEITDEITIEEPTLTPVIEEPEIDSDGKRRRRIRAPVRYEGVVEGKELDSILKEEGVIDEDDIPVENDETYMGNIKSGPEIIGRTVTEDGKDLNSPVLHRRKPKLKKKIIKPGCLRRKKKFICEVCGKEFLHFGRYEYHKKFHNVQYACKETECVVKSADISVIEQHQVETGHVGISRVDSVDSIDGVLQLPLDIEPSKTIDIAPKDLEEQPDVIPAKPGKQVKCEQCNKTFSCKQNLETHIRALHTSDRPFKCELCPKSFAYANSLKIHMMKHRNNSKMEAGEANEPQFPCSKCDKVFVHPSSLFYHKETEHNNGRRFVCNKCDKSFKHRQLLQRHQLVHSDDRPFKCSQCPNTFKTKANLLNHQAVHSREKKYFCQQCGQSFAHRTSLSLHQRWHLGSKPFKCDVCNKNFSQKGNLQEHQRIHTGEKPYFCDHCGRSFTTSSQFKLHRKTHTGEKPWKCEYCQKAFLHKDTWKIHIRRHLNDRPYKCKHCPRAFTESWALKRHERLHYGEKPYACDHCGKKFADYSNMKKHKRTHVTNYLKHLHFIAGSKIETKSTEFADENTQPKFLIDDEVENVPFPADDSIEKAVVELFDGKSQESSETPETTEDVSSTSLTVRQLLDQEGNPISFTTPDGFRIPIVSSMDEKISGLMPDGSLVAIDFLSGTNSSKEDVDLLQSDNQMFVNGDEVLLNREIQFLSDETTNTVNIEKTHEQEKLDNNLQFLTNDGNAICFITNVSKLDDEFLTIN